jgi:hypothetical protein
MKILLRIVGATALAFMLMLGLGAIGLGLADALAGYWVDLHSFVYRGVGLAVAGFLVMLGCAQVLVESILRWFPGSRATRA